MKLDPVEIHFMQLQRRRFSDWLEDRDRVKNFILECMVLLVDSGRISSWENFVKTGAWERIREYATPRQQFEFMKLYAETWKEVNQA